MNEEKHSECGWWGAPAGSIWVCPKCKKPSDPDKWIEGEVGCDDCGEHAAVRCPECKRWLDHVWGSEEIQLATEKYIKETVGRVGVCSLGRPGLIIGRKQLPWGEAWVGIGLDGVQVWSSRNPRILTQDEIAKLPVPEPEEKKEIGKEDSWP